MLQEHALNYPWLCLWYTHSIVQYIQVISTLKGIGVNCTYIGESQPSNDYMAACNTLTMGCKHSIACIHKVIALLHVCMHILMYVSFIL